jgi:hypothetical protein
LLILSVLKLFSDVELQKSIDSFIVDREKVLLTERLAKHDDPSKSATTNTAPSSANNPLAVVWAACFKAKWVSRTR